MGSGGDSGGIAGGDGQTHHGLLDIAYLRAVPNIILMAPKDEGEMRDMLFNAGAEIRYQPRPNLTGVVSINPDFSQIESAITSERERDAYRTLLDEAQGQS